MAALSGDIRVWSFREDVVVRDADFSAVRYQDKSSVSKERVYYESKKRYIEARGGCVVPKNSKPFKLRDNIKEFEDLLSSDRVVKSVWINCSPASETTDEDCTDEPCRVYQVVFSSGILCSLVVSAASGDIRQLSIDKYLVGKLLSEHLVDVAMTSDHLIISYNDARLTVVHMDPHQFPGSFPFPSTSEGASSAPPLPPSGLISRHPSLYTTQLAGPHGRRFQRKLSTNTTGEKLLIWWERSEDEVYPWFPLERNNRDRANVLVHSLHCGQVSLDAHCRTEMPPLSVQFSSRDSNVILSVEQGFSKRGGVTIRSCVYKVEDGKMSEVSVTVISLEAPVVSHAYSPAEDALLLACNNGVIALHSHANTYLTRAALSPRHVSWLQPGSLFAVANDRGHIQCFDSALGLVRLQIGCEESPSCNSVRLLELSDYFCHHPSLWRIAWAPAPLITSSSETKGHYHNIEEQHSSLLLLLHFIKGPLLCVRLNAPHFSLTQPAGEVLSSNHQLTQVKDAASCVSTRQQHYGSMQVDCLVGEYLRYHQVEEAVSLCGSLCWEQHGAMALKCITAVINSLVRRCDLNINLWQERVLSAAQVLSSGFLSNSQKMSEETEMKFGPPIRALARRLFLKLHRTNCLHAAFELAKDLGDPDCYLLLSKTAHRKGLTELSLAAERKAKALESVSGSSSDLSSDGSSDSQDSVSGSSGSSYSQYSSESCSTCSGTDSESGSSCSTCSDSESSESEESVRGEREGGDGREDTALTNIIQIADPIENRAIRSERNEEHHSATRAREDHHQATRHPEEHHSITRPLEDHHSETRHRVEHHSATRHRVEHHSATRPREEHHSATRPREEHHSATRPREEHHSATRPREDHHSATRPREDHHSPTRPREDHHSATRPREDHHSATRAREDHHSATRAREDHHSATRAREDHHSATRAREDHHSATRAREDYHSATRAREDYHSATRAREDHHSATRVSSGLHLRSEADRREEGTSLITSQDGKVTINIPDSPDKSSKLNSSNSEGGSMLFRRSQRNMTDSLDAADAVLSKIMHNRQTVAPVQETELSTEDEEGGTVKVVHFGIV